MKNFFVFVLCSASLFLAASCRCGQKSDVGCIIPADTSGYARYLRITPVDGFTDVEVLDPWHRGRFLKRYILVPDSIRTVQSDRDGIIIRTPVKSMVIYSGVHAALMEELRCTRSVKGVCEAEYITSAYVREGIRDGSIADLGDSFTPDIEKIIGLAPDIIIASPFENSGYGAAEKTGIPIVEGADYMENHPLGRTEWIRFFALLTGREALGDSLIRATTRRYESLRALAESSDFRPTVIAERKYGGSWGVAGRESYMAVLYRDAGARYLFDDVPGTGSVKMSFEEVFEKGIHADFWLLKYASEHPFTYDALSEEYPPYRQFDAFRDRHVLGCNTLTTPYYDDIILHPDRILESLIRIFHPEIPLPDGERYGYFEPLGE